MKPASTKTVRILGTQGVPANYGGFETAAENIGLYMARHGWRVIVYCQISGSGPITEDTWNGLERVLIPINPLRYPGWKGTSKFDWLSIKHACKYHDVCLTLGYNTGMYNFRQWIKGIPNVINMDGIEWSRKRWGLFKQIVLYVNERFAAFYGNKLIADHPEIEKYLWTRAPRNKVLTMTYGADPIQDVPAHALAAYGLEVRKYLTLIARPIPENSILELVKAFSVRPRGQKLVVFGKYTQDDLYHRQVMEAASQEVVFPGAIYDKEVVQAIRFHATGYLHGHTVGGTNPSLVEAMAAGNAVIAHGNPYNRWVAQGGALYFGNTQDADGQITRLLHEEGLPERLSAASLARFAEEFTWDQVAGQYEQLLSQYVACEAYVTSPGRDVWTREEGITVQ